jgi:hypothetical protein
MLILEAVTRLLGLSRERERERGSQRDIHTHTHTKLIWVSLEIFKVVCLFDVEIYCVIKGLVGTPELPIEMLLLVWDKAMEMPYMCVCT